VQNERGCGKKNHDSSCESLTGNPKRANTTGYERFMAIQQSRSIGTALTLAKDGQKWGKRVKIRLAVFVLCATSLLSGQAMKIERSGYEPEIKTNLMVATVVTNPNIHYVLTCSPDRNDCELLLAGERYEFTPAPERVYPTGPNLATHGDGKRIVVLVQRTNTF
jgi:hypothetical protein